MERWPLLEVESNDEVSTVIWLVDSLITLGKSQQETEGSICLTIWCCFSCGYKKGGLSRTFEYYFLNTQFTKKHFVS